VTARELPIKCGPGSLVSANRRISYWKRAELQKLWRRVARTLAANDQTLHGAWYAPDYDTPPRARITVTIRFPNRRTRDVGNYYPLVAKPIVDGLKDAGWLVDDSDDHLIGPDLRRDPELGPHRVTVRIEALPA
jgi:hypothetical protein